MKTYLIDLHLYGHIYSERFLPSPVESTDWVGMLDLCEGVFYNFSSNPPFFLPSPP